MLSADKRWAFVYNGECYNFRDLRNTLADEGEEFRSSGDTEVVMRLLGLEGASALARMNAMFALALWDEWEQTLLLARDRYGQKPLYYTRVGKLILFASEVRTLLASGMVPRKADPAAIRSYLAYGAVQGHRTIVSGISLLPPASYALFEPDGKERRGTFWSYPIEKKSFSVEELRSSFTSAVQRHLISDAPIGIFLSGGIDSSAIVAAAACEVGERVKTLSVVFPEQRDYSEEEYATTMALRAGTDHSTIPVTGAEMRRMLPHVIDSMDQPTGDGFNTYLVSHAARQSGLKVALSGLGGDELFGGYSSFRDVPRILHGRRLLGPFRKLIACISLALGSRSKRLDKMIEILDAPADLLPSYLAKRRVFSSRQMYRMAPELFNRGWDSCFDADFYHLLERLVDGRAIEDAVGILEMRAYMGQTLLRDSDVMGMNHGLEIRIPFLDTEFSSQVLQLDSTTRQRRTCPKWRFVEAMGKELPGIIVNRPKQGFTLPFKDWMLNELKEEITEGILALLHACDKMRKDSVCGLWDEFCNKPQRIGWYRPWILFVLGRYLQKHGLEL
jgi:asparagine synthase (glutamine-hydrolysing)